MLSVKQVKVDVLKNSDKEIKNSLCKKLGINLDEVKGYKIKKQSLDARDKNLIYYVYELIVDVYNENKILRRYIKDVSVYNEEKYIFNITGSSILKNRPVIVGSGPAGLFAAYILAENGYKPIIIERGEKIEDRINSVNDFWETGKLNRNSNVQFGEGGAGTFSDGKLNTMVNDNMRHLKVFETFYECGANEDILYSYKPHIGTDILRSVIVNLRNKIINMGGEIHYNTCLTDIIIENNKVSKIVINNSDVMDTECLVLAIGHSARDTFKMLMEKNINMESKPFAVGVRVMHPQEMIDISQYGEKYKDVLSKATYKLTYQASNGRGVYSFCMCPGGYVVNASSEEGRLVVNGMSNHDRESKNANNAIVVTVSKDDFGSNVLDGIEFQRKLESLAYNLCNGSIPVQLLKDFNDNIKSDHFGNCIPEVKGNYEFSNLNDILPDYISDSLKEAFNNFGKKIKGFDMDDAILAGIESRTSSPVRINRNNDLMSNIEGIYPCGEGAGYAGGITSAAIDGIKVAEAIGKKYKNNEKFK